ncbi:hypothetical protein FSARC_13892 [Fusarium sarcochroum]|uniref:Erythromycin biosynthesis protein CIII-like C-terminal domain-containing protein n=1 Tax=Fusarium sarcochroum TaxID=1208366 RepID=A0A8H4WRZ2_9HYPO|nr:hypothetical protein FSARC_13892 [Fusarium sarcochroum]
MLSRRQIAATLFTVLIGIFYFRSSQPIPPPISGRKDVVLFISESSLGLANAPLAAAESLLERHPSVEVHYASFERLKSRVERMSITATAHNKAAHPITWHEIPYEDMAIGVLKKWGNMTGFITPPGLAGVDEFMDVIELLMAPLDIDDHWKIYHYLTQVITEVDPGVIVIDTVFRPAIEVTEDLNRKRIILSPNGLDTLPQKQPWLSMLWKYPELGSGLPYPMAWSQVPENTYLIYRKIRKVLFSPWLNARREYLKGKGIKNPIDAAAMYPAGVPWLTMSFPEASIPMLTIPKDVVSCGPVILDLEPAEKQDPELAKWLSQAPTILVNLGSMYVFTEEKAKALVHSFFPVFEKTDAQILFKIKKVNDFNDSYLEPLKQYIDNGRLRVESWIATDIASILLTGNVVVSVHHAGSNLYHETILAGVPHVVLPQWFDCYNIAASAEYLGIGVWPGRNMTPEWDSAIIGEAIVQVMGDETMRQKAQDLGKVARTYGGQKMAADIIAKAAAEDETVQKADESDL